jgi:hypothetical protein
MMENVKLTADTFNACRPGIIPLFQQQMDVPGCKDTANFLFRAVNVACENGRAVAASGYKVVQSGQDPLKVLEDQLENVAQPPLSGFEKQALGSLLVSARQSWQVTRNNSVHGYR